tara:strand:- start:1016 stop:1351 length:336 start_codon:yes stop_codon:yes gene_type:complete
METIKSKINIQSIPPDQSVEITIGGIYYQRLNKLIIDYCDSVDQKQLLSAMAKIKLNKFLEKDDYAFNLETLVILVKAIEEQFRDAGLSVDNEIEIDMPAPVTEDDIIDEN